MGKRNSGGLITLGRIVKMTEIREPLTINHWNVYVDASIHANIFAFLLLHI